MAQVIGSLREDQATHGEKVILKLLRENLPKEYTVYVECPLPVKRNIRNPDFVVVTNYGAIILEVKDWIQITSLDAYHAQIRTRKNEPREEKNPVGLARELAILFKNRMKALSSNSLKVNTIDIPWGFAVILPNLPTSVITRLRHVWGEEFVLNRDDLDPPLILDRMKKTLPEGKSRTLKKEELDFIRAAINPTVYIKPDGRLPVILDDEQEQIIAEPVKIETPSLEPSEIVQQQILFDDDQSETKPDPEKKLRPLEQDTLSRNASIRLVRGVAGSGKTLVLTQRARYLAAQYPEWNLAILTYNDPLKQHFEALFKGQSRVKSMTFHSLCSSLLRGYLPWREPTNSTGWLEAHKDLYPVLQQIDLSFVSDEISWIKETGVASRQEYLSIERRGRGEKGRLGRPMREQVYTILEDYQSYLNRTQILDWSDLPHVVMKGILEGAIEPLYYDAILIDEAQDFAPVWVQLVTRLLHPEHGTLFLADDPAQSIYRFFSWREKGVPVTGRTRWLKVPYRNTYEIYRAAYQLIATDPRLQKLLEEEGMLVVPDLSVDNMQHGRRPLIQHYSSFDAEMMDLRSRITLLLQNGVDARQIAVLHRRKSGVKRLEEALRGLDVNINTYHAYKGLEYEAVFLTQLQETEMRSGASEEEESGERRLVYMAMTRARQELSMGYTGKLPKKFQTMREFVDMIE